MKVPFSLTAAVELEKRREQMLSAIARGLPRLQPVPISDTAVLHIACYGPSLADTWQSLGRPLLSMSGATRWLHDRGVTPDYHIEMDPRADKTPMLTPPVPGVTYLLASVCHPSLFDAVSEERVVLWHVVSSTEEEDEKFLLEHDPGQWQFASGSNVGLGALQIGGALGFRHFEVHGMDGSFQGDRRHAGIHTGKPQKADQTWQVNHKQWYTSRVMANGVAETINALRLYPMFCVFHGDGLTQALVREENIPTACCADETVKAASVRAARAMFVDHTQIQRKDVKCWSAWDAMGCAKFRPEWLERFLTARVENERRRERATFNTGSVGIEAMLQLRAVCEWKRPKVAVEVGTFIGNSTVALEAEHVYTCDQTNDVFPASERITTFPGRSAGEMCEQLVERKVRADLMFIDGRLRNREVPLVKLAARPDAVWIFDDFFAGGKGEANIKKLAPLLPGYGFVGPYPAFKDRSSLAMLVPLS